MNYKFSVGQKVRVNYTVIGVIEQVSQWDKITKGHPLKNTPCYFVRVPSWDNGTNGGRWLGEYNLSEV